MKKGFKKFLTILLSVAMICSYSVTAFAAEGGEGDSPLKDMNVSVFVTAQAEGAFLAPPQEITVNGYEAEAAGYTDEIKDGVSALDVLVAEHKVIFGETFTADPTACLATNESGWISTIFGVETINTSYAVNGKMPHNDVYGEYGYGGYNINQAKVADGDNVEFWIYQDGYAADYYLNIDGENTVEAGKALELTITGYPVAYCGLDTPEKIAAQTVPMEEHQLATVNMETGVATPLEGVVTDEAGKATVTFAEPGEYVVTMLSDVENEEYVIMPLYKVTVTETVDEEAFEIINSVSMFNPETATYVSKNSGDVVKVVVSSGKSVYSKAFVGTKDEAEAAAEAEIIPFKAVGQNEAGSNLYEMELPVSQLDGLTTICVYTKNWYERDIIIDREAGKVYFYPTERTVSMFDNITAEEAVAKAAEIATPELVDQMIEAIYVQVRNDNTDKYCTIAKALWDALSDADKELVEEGDYFGADTGDASLDNPLNQDEIGDKELLVVSFGTSFNDSRVKTIGGVEKALQAAYPEYSVRRAFTAQIIINHIQSRDGEVIDNMQQALDRAVANGVKELVVQPTHLMHGYEYDEMCEELEKYADKIDTIKIAEPLLNSDADKKAVAEAIAKAAVADAGYATAADAAKDGVAFVFMGHGTSHDAKDTYTQMQEVYTAAGMNNVFIGTVEGEPESTSLPEVKKAVEAAGFTKVILRPLMVVAGDHANNDMAADEEGSWYYGFAYGGEMEVEGSDEPVDLGAGFGAENVTSQIAGLGEIPAVQDVYVAHSHVAIGHKYATVIVKKATTKAAGKTEVKCSVCGHVKSTATVKKIASVKLAKTAYVYSAKYIKPAVTVKNSAGTKLASSNYTVSYKNNKKVGKATVTIKFKGKYSGTVTKTFKINPKTTSISKLAKGKKSIKVTWKKQATQTTGYQIRYSTKKSMSGAKTVTVKSTKTTSKTIKNLKAKKKYYVQVRTYKTVNGVKYYGAWSGKKYTTTK